MADLASIDIVQFANLPMGAAALFVAWKLGFRAIRSFEKRLEQDAAREIAERQLRIGELNAAREERREERGERSKMIDAIARFTTSLERHEQLQEQILTEIRESRCRFDTSDLPVVTRGR